MNGIWIEYLIGKNYNHIIKSKIYEPIILKIMNQSRSIFKGEYKQIINQSNNESDFENINKTEYFDAKILFQNEICQNIEKGKISEWIVEFSKNTQQEYSALMDGFDEKDILDRVSKTKLYKEFKNRIGKMNENENCILFLPFPVTIELESSIMVLVSSSIYHLVIRAMIDKDREILKKNEVFIIYPNIENKIVIRKIFDGNDETFDIEFITDYYLNDYIRVVKAND